MKNSWAKPRSLKRAVIFCSWCASITGSTPSTRETTSTVRSSSVGPSPPEHTTTRALAAATRSAASRSGSSSVTELRQRTCAPSSVSRSARYDELVSTISPRLSSSPMVSTSASSFSAATKPFTTLTFPLYLIKLQSG